MVDAFSRRILNQRPRVQYFAPPSEDVIPELSAAEPDEEKPARIQRIADSLAAIEVAAQVVENSVADRAKNVTLTLNLSNPEDFVAAQAAARLFPDKAVEVADGISVVPAITFDMYHSCVKALKEHGKEKGKSNQMSAVFPDMSKTDFGGFGADRRPELNVMSLPFVPIDILAYVTTSIPLLFGMLFPLIQLYVKSSIVAHTHLPPVGGPGVPAAP